MALVEGCKHQVEISVPAEEVREEIGKAVEALRQKARVLGFRPGKTPDSVIRSRFSAEIRRQVLESLVPKHFQRLAKDQGLRVVGAPDVSEVQFEPGQPLVFKAEFEVAPEFDLQPYTDLSVPYSDPVVTEEDVAARLEALRHQKADYVNLDPRPAQDGDYVAVALESLSGVSGDPIQQDDLMLLIGDADTLPAFSENLRGMTPGEEKEFEVRYPEGYGQQRLAGRTVLFRARLQAVRRKELPELNDQFAQDVGDYQTMEELREAVRRALLAEKEHQEQEAAKALLLKKLVALHEFPVPEAYVERQIQSSVEGQLWGMAARGVDITKMRLNWGEIRSAQRETAEADVRAALVLERIADREAIDPTMEEVDREVQRIAKQEGEPVALVRQKLEESGALRRIATRIRTAKTLNFLFERARKVPPEAA